MTYQHSVRIVATLLALTFLSSDTGQYINPSIELKLPYEWPFVYLAGLTKLLVYN